VADADSIYPAHRDQRRGKKEGEGRRSVRVAHADGLVLRQEGGGGKKGRGEGATGERVPLLSSRLAEKKKGREGKRMQRCNGMPPSIYHFHIVRGGAGKKEKKERGGKKARTCGLERRPRTRQSSLHAVDDQRKKRGDGGRSIGRPIRGGGGGGGAPRYLYIFYISEGRKKEEGGRGKGRTKGGGMEWGRNASIRFDSVLFITAYLSAIHDKKKKKKEGRRRKKMGGDPSIVPSLQCHPF